MNHRRCGFRFGWEEHLNPNEPRGRQDRRFLMRAKCHPEKRRVKEKRHDEARRVPAEGCSSICPVFG